MLRTHAHNIPAPPMQRRGHKGYLQPCDYFELPRGEIVDWNSRNHGDDGCLLADFESLLMEDLQSFRSEDAWEAAATGKTAGMDEKGALSEELSAGEAAEDNRGPTVRMGSVFQELLASGSTEVRKDSSGSERSSRPPSLSLLHMAIGGAAADSHSVGDRNSLLSANNTNTMSPTSAISRGVSSSGVSFSDYSGSERGSRPASGVSSTGGEPNRFFPSAHNEAKPILKVFTEQVAGHPLTILTLGSDRIAKPLGSTVEGVHKPPTLNPASGRTALFCCPAPAAAAVRLSCSIA